MTGAKIGDPYKSLAASIVLRAQWDCKGKIESSAGPDTVKALIQHDAVRWLESNPWCESMLYLGLPPEYQNVPQEFVAKQAIKRRKKSYIKHFSKVDMDAWIPVSALAELTGIDRSKIYHAIHNEGLAATQRGDGHWCSTLTELAVALVMGMLKINNTK